MLNSITSPLDGIRSPFGSVSSNPFAAYAIGGQTPQTIADFEADKYRANGTTSTAASLLTHTRSGNAVQVADDGTLQWAGHNLLTYSEQFDNASWVKLDVTVTANAATAPDGTLTADKIVPDNAAAIGPTSARLYKTYTNPAAPVLNNGAVWLKAGEFDTAIITIVGGAPAIDAGVTIDLTNGSLSSATGTFTPTVIDEGDGWYKVTIGDTSNSTSATPSFSIYPDDSTASTGDGTSGIYIWGAHVYRSDLGGMADIPTSYRGLSSSSTYLPTTTAARYLPRVDNHIWDGSSWVKRCLVEPQSTNLVTYSSEFDNAAWTKFSVTINANQTTAPDGTSSADAMSWPATATVYMQQNVVLTAGQTATISVWVKSDGGSQTFRLYGDNTIASSDFTATEEWQRFSFTYTVVTGGAGRGAGITRAASVSAFSGFIWGAQVEASSVPTSYIPTAGATVTRPADALSIDSTLLPYDSTAMTIAMDGEMTYADEETAAQAVLLNWAADIENRIVYQLWTNGQNIIKVRQEESNIADDINSDDNYAPPGINTPFNVASRHTSSDVNAAFGGTAKTVDTTPTALPDLSATDFQIAPTGVVNIKSLRILGGYGATDAELEAATT